MTVFKMQTLNSLQSQSEFELRLEKTVQQIEVLGITHPSIPRKPKWLTKFLNENEALLYNEVSDVKRFYSHFYFNFKNRILTAGIRSCRKHWPTYFKCHKQIRVSQPTRGCSFRLLWGNKSLYIVNTTPDF